ncbi:MAG: hypothetical protein R3F11_15860 [Verrucomicrobiales bacterium]
MLVGGSMVLSGSTLNPNGHALTVSGSFLHSGGALTIAAGTLEVGGDYRLQSWDGSAYGVSGGLLRMQDPAGRVVVGGDFATDSASSHSRSLTAGTLELRGSFTQLANYASQDPASRANFLASGSHRVLLTGDAERDLFFTNPTVSGFAALEIDTAAPVHHLPSLNCATLVANGNPLTDGLVIGSRDFSLAEDLAVDGSMVLAGSTLSLNSKCR